MFFPLGVGFDYFFTLRVVVGVFHHFMCVCFFALGVFNFLCLDGVAVDSFSHLIHPPFPSQPQFKVSSLTRIAKQ